MLDELAMAYQVMRRPNSAFAALRDDDRRYFLPSVVVMLLASAAYSGIISAMPESADEQAADVAAGIWMTILLTVAAAGTTYLISRALGGNKSWRKVFTVFFYVDVIWIPLAVVSLPSLLPSFGLQLVAGIALAAFFVWVIIVHVKAIKVLNGFGTAKAFGILILSWVIQMFWVIPVTLLYLVTLPFELPVV